MFASPNIEPAGILTTYEQDVDRTSSCSTVDGECPCPRPFNVNSNWLTKYRIIYKTIYCIKDLCTTFHMKYGFLHNVNAHCSTPGLQCYYITRLVEWSSAKVNSAATLCVYQPRAGCSALLDTLAHGTTVPLSSVSLIYFKLSTFVSSLNPACTI